MIKIKKSAIGMFVLAFTSLILITGSPFQTANNLVENNGHLYIKNIGQKVYAAEDEGNGGDDDGGSDDGGSDDDSADEGEDSDSGDGDSEDSSSVEDFNDGSDSDGSEEGTSASDDGPSNDDGGEVDSPAPEFFSASEPTSTPEGGQSNLQPLSNPVKKEPTAKTLPLSTETEALPDGPENDATIGESDVEKTLRHIEGHNPISAQDVCDRNYGEWNDGTCEFDKDQDPQLQVEFEHSLWDKGLYDFYYEKQQEKERDQNIEKACDKIGKELNDKGECVVNGNEKKADEFDKELSDIEQAEKADASEANENEEDKLTGYDEDGKQLNVINNDYEDSDEDDD
jgi:hypothetical protein